MNKRLLDYYIINSLLDNDLYKFTMMQTALHLFPTVEVEYKLIIRSKTDLRALKYEIGKQLDHLCSLRFTQEQLDYLAAIRFVKPDFVYFLEDFTLKRKFVRVYEENGQLAISVKGPWVQTILFEVPILAIIEEIYCKTQNTQDVEKEGMSRLLKKIETYNEAVALGAEFRIMEFGTRRRYSREWQRTVVKNLADKLNHTVLTGTSNLELAKEFDLKPQGTMAHEYIQAGQGLGAVQLVKSQKYMLEKWAEEYRGNLGIALTDTICMDAFLKDFDLYLAKLYDGCRHDSGDPIIWGEKLIAHYEKMGIDPKTKIAVFSDKLNPESALRIAKHFKGRIKITFGIGTDFSNDVGIPSLSIVMKLIWVNGNPVAKISDEPEKSVCEDEQYRGYLIFVHKKEIERYA